MVATLGRLVPRGAAGSLEVRIVSVDLGRGMPPVALADANGKSFDSRYDIADQPLLVMFMCNHCPYVKHVAPIIGELSREWAEQGVVIVAINSNDPDRYAEDAYAEMPKFAERHDWGFPYLIDRDQDVARSFGAVCTPDTFLFDQQGRLAYRGQIDDSRPGNEIPVTGESLRAAVEAVLSGEPVSADQQPSVGCSIKWKSAPTSPALD